MLGLYIGTGIVLVVFLLLYIKVSINVEFFTSPGNTMLTIKVSSIFNQLQKRYPLRDFNTIYTYISEAWKKRKEKKEDPPKSESKGKLSSRTYYSLVTFAMKRMVVERLDWKSYIGLDDAMFTALSSGGLWAVKGIITGVLSSKTRLQDINLQVEPDFNSDKLVSHIYCILKMRIVHIILIAFYFLVLTVRGYINGYRPGKADPSH